MSATVDEVVAAIRNGPAGPEIGAFFDFDGTLVQGYTANAVYRDQILKGQIGAGELARTVVAAVDGTVLGGNPHAIGEISFAALRGRTVDSVVEIAERLFVERIAGTIRPEARDVVRAHLRQGHTVVVASSATRMQIEPVARDLGIPQIVCTELEAEAGVFTGRSSTGMLWGERKAGAVRAFARTGRIDLKRSYGYANGSEDIAFLGSVGRPYALNPHPLLRTAAEQNDWPVLMLREPNSPGLRSCLSTAAAVLGTNLGLAAGVAYGWLTDDHRRGINTGIELSTRIGLALAGVKLNVVGAENLRSARPAVFIANHQSALDVLVLGALLRHDFTAVAKKEARLDPRMLVIGALLDPAWIDRGDPAKAKDALNGVVGKLRSGVSILILPEGTRMPTPNLGRFKKGAFHIAMQAGVPIVPIVLRNTGELAWRRSMVVSPGTVDVAVLDPISTDGWTAGDLDRGVAEVRRRVEETLADWPQEPAVQHEVPPGDPPGPVQTLASVTGRLLTAGASALVHPESAAASVVRFGASLRRTVVHPPGSPLFRGRTGEPWRSGVLECPLAGLEAAAAAAGGSVDDAYVAALLGGMRRYHERHGVDLHDLSTTVPVDLPGPDGSADGNGRADATFAAPAGVQDPEERIAALHGIMLSLRVEPALHSWPVLNRLPATVRAAVGGLSTPADLAPFGPSPGVAVAASMQSHAGTCRIGLTIDGSVVPDPQVLVACLREGLREVLALAR